MNITKEQMLEWLYQAIAMKRRGDGLRVICDAQWNADVRSAIRALIESSGDKASGPTEASQLNVIPIPDSDLFLAAKRDIGAAVYTKNKDGLPGAKVCSIEWHPRVLTEEPFDAMKTIYPPPPAPTIKKDSTVGPLPPLSGMAWVDSLLRACREINKDKPEHQKWIDEARVVLSKPAQLLPKEAEEAMKTLDGHFGGADFDPAIFGADDGGPIDAGRERLLSAYALIKAALRPKVVTRELLEKILEKVASENLDEFMMPGHTYWSFDTMDIVSLLRELGIEVGDKP